MKKINLILLLFMSAVMFTACEKESSFMGSSNENINTHEKKAINFEKLNQIDSLDIKIEFINEEISDEYTHHYKNIYNGMPIWTHKINNNIDFVRNVKFVYTPTVEVMEKANDTLTLNVDGSVLFLSTITASQDYLNFTVTSPTSDRIINYTANVVNEDFSDLLQLIEEGDVLDPEDQNLFWAPIIYGAGLIVKAAVDYYCSQKIINGASACAERGCGVIVHQCGVTCIEVCSN